ncbi:MAG: hypothetical protein PHQ36_01785 [Anaerolineales bacterium]|nr:hypothetical protein [Anaerolineales bacterium]
MTDKTFDKIELPEPPTSAKRVTRKGKKSVAWDADPEILKRLAKVAAMMIEGKYSWEIAETNKCSIATAKRDIKRVREIWKMEALDKLDSLMGDSLATYTRVQAAAWSKAQANPEKADRYLSVILHAQERVDKLSGVGKPETVNVEVSGQVEVKDIDQIRDQRWKQVADSLLIVVRKGE